MLINLSEKDMQTLHAAARIVNPQTPERFVMFWVEVFEHNLESKNRILELGEMMWPGGAPKPQSEIARNNMNGEGDSDDDRIDT